MVIPPNKKDIVAKADKDVLKIQKQYMDGLITDGERYNKVIDIWAQATEKVASEMLSASRRTMPKAQRPPRRVSRRVSIPSS